MSEPLADIPAVILAGGLGTRLRSAVPDRPKCLAPINGRPFLAWLLDYLSDAGVRRAVLCTGYLGAMVQEAFGSRYGQLSLWYSQEPAPLGTGGALRAALDQTEASTWLVLNGDSLCRADLAAFLQRHRAQASQLSLLLTHVPDTGRFGRVVCDAAGRIVRFVEKGHEAGPGWINAGVYLIERRVIESIPPQQAVSLEREVFPRWIGCGLYGHCAAGEFLDIGTPESFASAGEYRQLFAAAESGCSASF